MRKINNLAAIKATNSVLNLRMRRLISVLTAVIMLCGCKPKIPKDIIEPEKMQKILYDIHVADGYISTILQPDSSKKVAAAYYKGIYEKFGIDSAQYNKSMNYYYANPKDLDKIYKNISKTLESQKKTLEKVDSLQKAKIEKARIDKEKLKKAKDSLAKVPAKLKQEKIDKEKAEKEKLKKTKDSLRKIQVGLKRAPAVK
ncbi:DUF4296 domain-containing protein [Pedobacter jamesrossensis]|uniref:DUF4296 domain-containing protein n=1 Tax=Pedobacter jamesrossensis TaxID=1908238 RepID=A0ABV8NN84_9SPHI